MNVLCSGISRSFAKEMRALKRSAMAIIKAAPLTTTQEGAKELNVDHSRVIQHLRQIGEGEKFQ